MCVPTTDITTSFGWEASESYTQHDVQELLRVMLEALETEFADPRKTKDVSQVRWLTCQCSSSGSV